MYDFNQHLHFIGVGGVGMAGIAEVLRNLGYSVSGSDVKSSVLIEHLTSLGVRIKIGHDVNNITDETTAVVVSSAIPDDNIELVEARKRHLTIIHRAEMLSEIMRMKYGISVAGSHGKTTTTSIIAKILGDVGLDPTVIIGGRVLSQRSGARVGTGQFVVAEADESDGSFCLLRPAISVVTNIDTEHIGHYGSFGALEEAFLNFMNSIPFYGVIVACFDDPVVARLARRLKRRVISYGTSADCDIEAANISIDSGKSSFDLRVYDEQFGRVSIPMLGVHMVKNALASMGVGLELGVYVEEMVESLQNFEGVARRSELVGSVGGVNVFDDYGHHPTEIIATLKAFKDGWSKNSGGRLIVLFQPHRYSRTKELFSEFLTAFCDADVLMVGDIYPAGEDPIEGVSAELLAKAVQHDHVIYSGDLVRCVEELPKSLCPGDIVLTLGAGNVGQVAHKLVEELRKGES